MSVPSWVADSIFYQIFPDRFANGDTGNDPGNVQPWGAIPTNRGFQGGDLSGILQGLSYLQDLGVNALYLNPIFFATTNHRYNTTDYFRIDPRLGTRQTFLQLLNEAHAAGIRVILDGVFNHTGRGFFAFQDILENEKDSPYRDWYHVHGLPLDAYGLGNPKQYEAWWGLRELPKLNTDTKDVREYIFSVAKYWIDQGIDGWRLDVPNEIDDDAFWQEFRTVVKSANPDAYLVGEIWEIDPRWVGDGHFDGLMHYPFRDYLLDYLAKGKTTGAEFSRRIGDLINRYPAGQEFSQFLTLGSHDTERLHTMCGEDIDRVRIAFLIQFVYPGTPVIYYGDEIGLAGGKDPDNRRAFPWDQDKWSLRLRSWIQELIRIRKDSPALRHGQWVPLSSEDQKLCVFGRSLREEDIVVVVNTTSDERPFSIELPETMSTGSTWTDLLTGSTFTGSRTIAGRIKPYTGYILQQAALLRERIQVNGRMSG
ncbi:MAG: alpha-amylase [Anaerolineales bacterium]|nr:alpha-amylase [Anaerolineales bacterium]